MSQKGSEATRCPSGHDWRLCNSMKGFWLLVCEVAWMSDDETGYCRPPKKHQFPKGQSGNPKGRPCKTPSPAALDDAEIIRRLDANVIRVGDRDLTWLEAELIKIKEQALAGKPKAMRLWEKLHGAAVRPRGGGTLHMPASFFETEKFDAK